MPTAEVLTPRTFAEQILTTAEQSGFETRINRNGDRQIDFANKSLTEKHLRLLFQDISRKAYVYSRADADLLLGGSRPCAIAPFFDLSVRAGLAREYEENGKKLFRFYSAGVIPRVMMAPLAHIQNMYPCRPLLRRLKRRRRQAFLIHQIAVRVGGPSVAD